MPTNATFHYPEREAGGYTRFDGSVEFYVRVRSLLELFDEQPTVLDFGAGRGVHSESAVAVHRYLTDLRPLARCVVGVDVDAAVQRNPLLTEAHIVGESDRLPLDDESVDLIVADHVFEHLATPVVTAAELHRVLRPGGWVCARTPNRYGYIATAARLVPMRLRGFVLRYAQPNRLEEDVFPTFYRLNTRASIGMQFPSASYRQIVYGWDPEPSYLGRARLTSLIFLLLRRITPEGLRPVLMVFLQKRAHLEWDDKHSEGRV